MQQESVYLASDQWSFCSDGWRSILSSANKRKDANIVQIGDGITAFLKEK